jgi:hypothetical protein
VVVPVVLELTHIVVDGVKKEHMQNPQVGRILVVETMKTSETRKERTPRASKLAANFYPKAFDAHIARRCSPEEASTVGTAVLDHPDRNLDVFAAAITTDPPWNAPR